MNKSTQDISDEQGRSLSKKIGEVFKNPTFISIVISIFLLLVEYRSGFFQSSQDSSNHSISPLWFGFATFITIFLLTSFQSFVRICLNPQKYFREEFSFVAFFITNWLLSGLLISLVGKQMFWYPLLAVAYSLLDQKLTVSNPSWEAYAFLLVSTILFYLVAFIQHQNWVGIKSVQQHQREQAGESGGILSEGMEELKRILWRRSSLKSYSEPEYIKSISELEQPEDFISQAWEEQARELIRLSSSSYVIEESGWHDRQGCWVGQNIDNGKLFFLYPAQSKLSNQDLENFVRYSKEISKLQAREVSELIIAFKETKHKLDTPSNSNRALRFETEQSLLEKLVNFTDYRHDIQKRVLINKLPESDQALHDVYVPSKLLTSEEFEEKKLDNNVEEFLQQWLDEPGQRHVALLGDYGQGKSSTALMFTYHLLCKSKQLPKRIPILIELRGKSPRDLIPVELLGAWASQYRIEAQALMRLHIAGRLILIFEGFDEMALIGNSELRLRHFRSLWKFCYPNAKIIITGRPNFFLDDKEMKTALGIIKPINNRPYCEAVRLAPFDVEQIREALRGHNPLVQSQIYSLAKTEPRFLDLVSRPSLLHVVSVLWEREKLYKKTALLSSAYVMGCFVRNSYLRQGIKAQGSRKFMALNTSERDYYMCGTASYMAANELSNQISNEQLNELIISLTEVIPESVSASPSAEILDEDTKPLQQRIHDPKEDIEHITTDVRTCGLLVDDPSAPGRFKFGHKSFMEYLFATTVKEYIWDDGSEKARAIRNATNFSIEVILDLPISLGFLVEMIGTDTTTRQLNDSNKKNSRGEYATAIGILKVIFGVKKNPFYWFVLRVSIFCGLFVSNPLYVLSRKKPHSPRYDITYIHTLAYVAWSLIPLTCALLLLRDLSFANSPSGSTSNVLTLISTVFSTFMITIAINRSTLTSKLCLWNSICKELQIGDKALHQVTGSWYVPWMKHQKFDYFLINQRKTRVAKLTGETSALE